MSSEREQIEALLGSIDNLPTIPKMGMRIVELASDPEVSITKLSEAIHQDPPLAARVLKVANSPFYGVARHVDSLQLALVILGLNEVRTLALGVTFFNVMKSMNPEISLFRETFWFHSAACGIVARILGRKLDIRSEGADFIAGLLHDMGKIVIDACFGGKFASVFDKTFKDAPPMIDAEKEIVGHTHEPIGAVLAEKWHLPQSICDAIAFHHAFPTTDSAANLEDPKIASVCYLSEAFCQRYKIGWDGDSGSCDLRNSKAWETILSGQDKYTESDIDGIITETLQTYTEARPLLLWE